jgi:hypothetical protein
MNTIIRIIGKTIGWLCRIVGVWAFFGAMVGVYVGLVPPVTLLVPVGLYALGSWLVEGDRLFTIRWK